MNSFGMNSKGNGIPNYYVALQLGGTNGHPSAKNTWGQLELFKCFELQLLNFNVMMRNTSYLRDDIDHSGEWCS